MLQRLGFPAIGEHRRFVVAMLVDAIGSGIFLPISILYFLSATSLSIVHIGLALSIAAALQLPCGPLLGMLVDRVGAKRVLLAANLIEAVGFLGYVFAGSFVTVLIPAAVVQLGQTAFWGSYSPVVAGISAPGERERWFGFLGALRNASLAIGGLAAAAAITIGTPAAYTVVVLLNMVSYLLAFALLLGVKTAGRPIVNVSTGGPPAGWRQVLSDHPYLLMVATNYTYATSAMALNIAMPVYITHVLGFPGWVAGAVFTINTLLIGLGQGLVVSAMGGSIRANIVALGLLLYAASYVVLLAASWLPVVVGVAVVLAGIVVYTGGELAAGPVLTALSTDAAPDHLRGRYVSLYQMSWTVAMTISPVALTWLLEQGATALMMALLGVSVLGAALSTLLRRVMPLAAAAVSRNERLAAPV